MSPVDLEISPRPRHVHRKAALLFVMTTAVVAASLSGCMRAGATTMRDEAEVRTLVVLEKTTSDGWHGETPLAEEYRAIRPAGEMPAIPPSETWPAQ